MTVRAPRRKSYDLGLRAEQAAALWLRLKGYRIIARRYKTPVGEIDIVARRGTALAMIEVKARARSDDGFYAVDARSRQRIENAARYFLAGHPAHAGCAVRFDIIVYAPPFSLKHLDNAWPARS